MKVWMFILLAAVLALPAEIIVNHISRLLWGRSSPPSSSRKGYIALISLFLCFTMAANQFNNAATEQQNKIVAQIPPAPAPAPTVIREVQTIYVPVPHASAQQDATRDPKNALTRVDPPSDKFSNQNVSPIPPGELAGQQKLEQQKFAKQQDDELKKQLIDGIRRATGIY